MILFLKFPSERCGPGASFFLLISILHGISLKMFRKHDKRNCFWNKVVDPTSLARLYTSWVRCKKKSQSALEGVPSGANKHLKRACLKKKEEKNTWNLAGFKYLPTDGAWACKPIGMDRRQLCLDRKEAPIADYANMKEREVSFGNQEYV